VGWLDPAQKWREMPTLTRWYLKSALIFFILALLAAFLQAGQTVLTGAAFIAALGPVYFHLFLVGWVTQLIFGVVYWMFPKYSIEKPRRSESLGWATFWLLNIGLIFRVVGEPLMTSKPSQLAGWLLTVSAVLQWLAGVFFFANTWGRIKEK
jgi:cbb3-type cytochrome oxidase subunit 1